MMLFPTPAATQVLIHALGPLAAATGGTPTPTPHVTVGYFEGDAEPPMVVEGVRKRLQPPTLLQGAGLFAWSDLPHPDLGWSLSLRVQRDAAVQRWQRAVRRAVEPLGLVAVYAWGDQQPHVEVVRHLPVAPSEALLRLRDRDYRLSFVGARLVVTQRDDARDITWLDQVLE